jgi:glutaredoxin
MNEAIVWGQSDCTYCDMAVKLLRSRNCKVEERKMGEGWNKKDLIQAVPHARSVPQIFVDGVYVGGYKELKDMVT